MATGSTITVRNQASNFSTADIVRAKIFVFDNEFESGTFLNASGAEASYAQGLVLGRIGSSNRLVPLDATATDGSQFPVGILANPITDLANAGTSTVDFCIFGDVNSSMVTFQETGQNLETVVSNRTLNDLIKSETKGVRLITIDDQTFADN